MTTGIKATKQALTDLGFHADPDGSWDGVHLYSLNHPNYPVSLNVSFGRFQPTGIKVEPLENADYRVRNANSKLPICKNFPVLSLVEGDMENTMKFIETYASLFLAFK